MIEKCSHALPIDKIRLRDIVAETKKSNNVSVFLFFTGGKMHEVALAEGIFRIVSEQVLKTRPGARVVSVVVTIGELSHAEPHALTTAFLVMIKNTPIDGARLIIERTKAEAVCTECDATFSPAELIFVCPHCGSPFTEVTAGQELLVSSIEIEVD